MGTRRPLIVQMVHDPSALEPRCRLQDEDSDEYGQVGGAAWQKELCWPADMQRPSSALWRPVPADAASPLLSHLRASELAWSDGSNSMALPMRCRLFLRPPSQRPSASARRCTCASWAPPSAARCAGSERGCRLSGEVSGPAAGVQHPRAAGCWARVADECCMTTQCIHHFVVPPAAHCDARRVCVRAQPDHRGHARLHPQGECSRWGSRTHAWRCLLSASATSLLLYLIARGLA